MHNVKYSWGKYLWLFFKPKKKSLYNLAGIEKIVKKSFFNNINDKNKIKRAISQVNPDIIFHLAAQPLVLESYKIR